MTAQKARPAMAERPILAFSSKDAWAGWLEANHTSSDGIFLRLDKKATGLKTLTYAEAVEAALCYGWVDGQSKGEGAATWLITFTPRRKRSIWSKRNREKALALIAAGAMKPAGLAEVERAQQDGRWEAAYDPPRTMPVPDDLLAALAERAEAKAFFEALDSQNRYAILFRLQTTKRPETRRKWLDQFVDMLARNEKLLP